MVKGTCGQSDPEIGISRSKWYFNCMPYYESSLCPAYPGYICYLLSGLSAFGIICVLDTHCSWSRRNWYKWPFVNRLGLVCLWDSLLWELSLSLILGNSEHIHKQQAGSIHAHPPTKNWAVPVLPTCLHDHWYSLVSLSFRVTSRGTRNFCCTKHCSWVVYDVRKCAFTSEN